MTTPTTTPTTDAAEPQPTERPRPAHVIEALARVMEELPGIGKDDTSPQGYNYRGIEAITRHIQTLMGKYCVVAVPRVTTRMTIDLTVNNKPWTEEQLEVVYTFYGPGGVDDRIEVGPLWGLGRDNSDKGANKAMTQAFKYALIQTFCIGDGKDDPDSHSAAEADARQQPVDPDRQARHDLRQRINALSPENRQVIAEYCDEHSIPRVTSKMDDEQLQAVVDRLDKLELGAETSGSGADSPQDRRSEGETPDAAEGPPEPSEGDSAPVASDRLPWRKVEAGQAPPEQDDVSVLDRIDDAALAGLIESVKALDARDVDKSLTARRLSSGGNIDTRRQRLVLALARDAVGVAPVSGA